MSRRALAPRRPIVATGRYICSKNSAFPARKNPQLIRVAKRVAPPSPRAGPFSRYIVAGRADQPSRLAGYRVAGARVGRDALRYRVDQPRPAARAHLTYHDLARLRHHPDPQRGLQGVRALA